MGQTAVEKIAEYHLADAPPERPLREGDYVSIWPRHVMTHGNTPAVFRKFESIGVGKIRAPRQPVICWGHEGVPPARAEVRRAVEAFAREHGLDYFGEDSGCGLRYMIDHGYVLPGSFVVASDPHTTVAGALGAVGTPIVRTDAAMIWATGEFWWQVPQTIQVVLSGFLRPGTQGSDVIFALRRIYDRGEAHNRSVEFMGPGLSSLDMEARFQIASGAADWGAVAAWFPADAMTLAFLEERRRALARRRGRRINESDLDEARGDPLLPDPDAAYAARILLDLDPVRPAMSAGKTDWETLRRIEVRPNGSGAEPERVEILEGFAPARRGRLVFLPVDELDTRAICGDAGDVDDPLPEVVARTMLNRVDPEFAALTQAGDVFVGGREFGSGPSREEAATAFMAKGITTLIAGSFAATFRRHALNNGLVVLECPELLERLTLGLDVVRGSGRTIIPGDEIEIDFAASIIRWRGETFAFPPFTRVPQLVVAAGGVESLLRQGVGSP